MSIWFRPFSLQDCEHLNQGINAQGSLMQTLDIKVTEIGDDYLTATMPAAAKNYNPLGMVHGGANVALAETVASFAANFVLDTNKYYSVGQEINANHIKAARRGLLTAIAKPIHLGRRSSVWQVKIFNAANELTCIARMTAAIMAKKHQD